ncbi:DUF397 domain-containing protein [Nocardia cerradoensis]|uniref:DUF397 domain-containing protein n=1 Tax=Nocardia cerradoensis TaxID=85688 RepID=A0A231HCX6_9NOCA|nr:DUF397 domain-containing protein [Nocardia cerradoensis]NKY47739.1 DUF397 domain-containing protein [Nocardia cerradoensis]OXR46770.1 hypothetical protein B7C42_01748 [Nocardia cerradoensis]
MTSDSAGPRWVKSSYSQGGGDCVEVAYLGEHTVGVRDSKDRTGPTLVFTPAEWDTFTTALVAGQFEGSTAWGLQARRSRSL